LAEESQRRATGEPVIQAKIAGDISHFLLDFSALRPAITAKNLHDACISPEESEHHPYGRRLARTIGTEEPEEFALLDAKVDIFHADPPTVTPSQLFDLDRAHDCSVTNVPTQLNLREQAA
jgi:hypothetical protein